MQGMRDSYRPNFGYGGPPPPIPESVRESMFAFDGVRKPANPRGRYGQNGNNKNRQYGPNYRSARRTASRPLLSQAHGAGEQMLRDPAATDKFRSVDELTDSDEDAMSESDDEEQPAKKVKTSASDSPAAVPASKWSNPDPYTALPPAAEGSGKRTDVLKLIRKAKISQDKDRTAVTEAEDFISFDFGDDSPFAAPQPQTTSTGQIDGSAGEHLGKRKRGHDEAMPRPPGGYLPPDKLVLPEWAPLEKSSAIPWYEPRADGDPPGIALHKEVIDFYEWVKPQEYEREVRADVLQRLSFAFNRIEPGELKAFGSYAAGLYLPVGDMDLVYFTRSFRPGNVGKNGIAFKPPKRLLDRFASLLRNQNIARPGSVVVIPFAKVPIVKFIEARSGLRVDLSFDNDSGVIANETFQTWKVEYPAMPVIVSVIKQFLMIRGLNDVATGGLGGFSIICLVTSLLQHMPGADTTTNLGQLLVEFFNLYGNLLDRQHVAIRMDPPGYLDKDLYKPLLFSNEKRNRLTIIDPNRPENNISGGTRLIEEIFDSFARAYDILQERLTSFEEGDTQICILENLVGGNFTAYEEQREKLRSLYFGLTGRAAEERKPPVKTKSTRGPSKVATNAKSLLTMDDAEPQKKLSKAENRAARLKDARPDLAKKLGETISVAEAVRIGGYADGTAMHVEVEAVLQKKLKEKNTAEKARKKKKKKKSKA